MDNNVEDFDNDEFVGSEKSLFEEFNRYLFFWRYFLISAIFFVSISLLYLRYAENIYTTSAKIEIIDKSMDSEMSLPTAMTIFNRSTINLENEIEIISSNRLIGKVVESLNLNVELYTFGLVKTSRNHRKEWIQGYDYQLDLKVNPREISVFNEYHISFNEAGLLIEKVLDGDILESSIFKNFSTNNLDNKLPFIFKFEGNLSKDLFDEKFILKLVPFDQVVDNYVRKIIVEPIGKESDLLELSIDGVNPRISREFIDELAKKFDEDGIKDRQLVYKRTIEFVDSRYDFLKGELDQVEFEKQIFKQENNLSDISSLADITSRERSIYDSDLFKAKTQYELTEILFENFKQTELDFLPVDIGIDNGSINGLIMSYNELIAKYKKIIKSSGENNFSRINAENEIKDAEKNIKSTIQNYRNSLNIRIEKIELKEKEFVQRFNEVPQNERMLRSIEREQEIKEALFLLLLQKREEASINYAVTKPSIKIVDQAITNKTPIYPKKSQIILGSILFSFLLPFSILFLWFLFDQKIHTAEQLSQLFPKIPVVGEIPFVPKQYDVVNTLKNDNARSPIAESFRMLIANLNFILFEAKKKSQVVLVTSTIKGEGKTFIAANIAYNLASENNKVILVGGDLRNPQIHKFFGLTKSRNGLSDMLYKNDSNLSNYIFKNPEKKNFDVLFSGTIPPNPSELLSSKNFDMLLEKIKKVYDYVIIDSAPCLLVSDTFKISSKADTTVYALRSNFTSKKIKKFIIDAKKYNKLKDINLVLNSVGNSLSYGYKYGYQYGYKYGYGYGYNYGYGYGYGNDKSNNKSRLN